MAFADALFVSRPSGEEAYTPRRRRALTAATVYTRYLRTGVCTVENEEQGRAQPGAKPHC
jgi:DNA-binding transcriptional regulator YiaG